jgi:hypothetical protein
LSKDDLDLLVDAAMVKPKWDYTFNERGTPVRANSVRYFVYGLETVDDKERVLRHASAIVRLHTEGNWAPDEWRTVHSIKVPNSMKDEELPVLAENVRTGQRATLALTIAAGLERHIPAGTIVQRVRG